MNADVTLLYVDDEPLNLLLFSKLFKNNCRVLTANSGTEGLRMLNEYPEINIVFSDMKMPVMNGLQFIKEARDFNPNIAYHIVTGYDMTPEIQDAINSGLVSGYFRKPFNVEVMKQAIG